MRMNNSFSQTLRSPPQAISAIFVYRKLSSIFLYWKLSSIFLYRKLSSEVSSGGRSCPSETCDPYNYNLLLDDNPVKVEAAVLGSPSLTIPTVSVAVKQHGT